MPETPTPAEKPKRITLSRAKGWRMPAGARKVDRSTVYGNPFSVCEPYPAHWLPADLIKRIGARVRASTAGHGDFVSLTTSTQAVECFRWWIRQPAQQAHREFVMLTLRGKTLACWCHEGQPCHADVLLELANAGDA